jgi:hypothetical protein
VRDGPEGSLVPAPQQPTSNEQIVPFEAVLPLLRQQAQFGPIAHVADPSFALFSGDAGIRDLARTTRTRAARSLSHSHLWLRTCRKPNRKCTQRRARLTSTVRGRRALRGAVPEPCTAECCAVHDAGTSGGGLRVLRGCDSKAPSNGEADRCAQQVSVKEHSDKEARRTLAGCGRNF